MSEKGNEDRTIIHIAVPLDASGYLRHECPSCALEFKVQGDESRFSDTLEWWAGKALAESGVSTAHYGDEIRDVSWLCPYCAASAEPHAFLHSEYRLYARRIAIREIAEPLIFKTIAEWEKSFPRGTSRNKLFSITLEFKSGSQFRSQRPIVGPDADDMVRVKCDDCEERFKLMEGWPGAIWCPSCRARLTLF